jgi:hypothetical protein
LSQYWPNAEAILKLFQTLLEKFRSKIVSCGGLRDRPVGGGEVQGEQMLGSVRQEDILEQGEHEVQEGDTSQYSPTFNGSLGYAPDDSPSMMIELDWQNIMFCHVSH